MTDLYVPAHVAARKLVEREQLAAVHRMIEDRAPKYATADEWRTAGLAVLDADLHARIIPNPFRRWRRPHKNGLPVTPTRRNDRREHS